ncbi:hypothetical protein J4439_00980 [Candidatus Woesearchaeota archaeon]|nr:hypothetical protein [Candidatus Woesearchaeota archaeon]
MGEQQLHKSLDDLMKDDMQDDAPQERRAGRLGSSFRSGLEAFPGMVVGTVLSYVLELQSCAVNLQRYMPEDGLNLGFHIAGGSGLYGGWTGIRNRKFATFAALAASMIPEAMLAANGDAERAGQMVGVKALGYGVGYLVGALFSGNWGLGK